MAEIEEWEKKALEKHEQIVRAFNSGKSGKKSAQLEDGTIRMRIAMHMLETGGGLTTGEIIADAKATEGKKWRNTNTDGTPIDINVVIDDMVAPGSSMKRMLEAAGGFGIIDSSLASTINEQNVLVKNGDKYYLWCQDGIDFGAKLSTVKEKLESAKKSAESIDKIKGEITSNEEKVQALRTEMSGLGFFKFSEKKAIKDKLASAEKALASARSGLQSAERAKSSIQPLTKEYETIREECKKRLS